MVSDRLRRVLRPEWLPELPEERAPARIVVHWTAGRHRPSLLERGHYHFLIDGEGKPHRGLFGVGRYGPPNHVKGLNTGSVGLALCGMRGAVERPFSPGPEPITPLQWERAAQAAAEVMLAYGLPAAPKGLERVVLMHSEVPEVYGIPQDRWDIDCLPWKRDLGPGSVHSDFRRRVLGYLARLAETS